MNHIMAVTADHEYLSILTPECEDDNPPVSLLNCSPKAITGTADAKNMQSVGANILTTDSCSTVNMMD